MGFWMILGAMSLFSACSDDTASANDYNFLKDEFISTAQYEELTTTYKLLDLAYIYAHMRNELAESADAYAGKGTSNDAKNKFDEESCSKGYYDVCYMFNQLGDPYTRYFDPSYAQEKLEAFLSPVAEIIFLGAEYALYDEANSLYEVTEASENAGEQELHIGDIFAANDVAPYTKPIKESDTASISFKVTRLVNNEATTVMVNARATRAKRPTVRLHYEKTESGESIPVIKITEFDSQTTENGGTYEEFAEALEKTKDSKSLIIDLRDNGGGDVKHCSATSAEFLSSGDTLAIDVEAKVYQRLVDSTLFQKLDSNAIVTHSDGSAKDRYVVMLANNYSASCAELMLSAIATNKKAPIVGKITYGKQIGQSLFIDDPEIDDDSFPYPQGLAIVTSIISYDKDWNQFHDVGIVPDYEITNRQEQMKKAVQLAAEAKEIRVAGYGTERLGHFAKVSATAEDNALRNIKLRYKLIKH